MALATVCLLTRRMVKTSRFAPGLVSIHSYPPASVEDSLCMPFPPPPLASEKAAVGVLAGARDGQKEARGKGEGEGVRPASRGPQA